jgi:hypothetical protein
MGGSGSHYMTADDDDDSRWVMKSTYFGGQAHAYLYLNETLSALIGREIGAPVPEPASLRLEPDQVRAFKPNFDAKDLVIFATARIDPSEPLSSAAVDAVDAAQPASIVVLDQLVWNTDRLGKPEHVLAESTGDGAWQLWAVDHGHTFCIQDTLDDSLLAAERVAQDPYDQLLRVVTRQTLEPIIEKALALGREGFERLIRMLPGEWIVQPDAPERLAQALERRAQALDKVLYVYV